MPTNFDTKTIAVIAAVLGIILIGGALIAMNTQTKTSKTQVNKTITQEQTIQNAQSNNTIIVNETEAEQLVKLLEEIVNS